MARKRSTDGEPRSTRRTLDGMPVAITNLLNEAKSHMESLEELREQDVRQGPASHH